MSDHLELVRRFQRHPSVRLRREAWGGLVFHRDHGDRFLHAAAEAHVNGARIDWTPLFPTAKPVELPTYAFQHRPFWLSSTDTPGNAAASAAPIESVAPWI